MQAPEIRVDVAQQRLELWVEGELHRTYPISTALNGIGHEPGSNRTPVGRFQVAEKFGHDAPLGAVFRSRQFTGEIGDPSSPDDLIQTRILWLDGLEPHNANTKERYIYIHGTNHEDQLGTPVSHGCVRMANADVAELFDLVAEGASVQIIG